MRRFLVDTDTASDDAVALVMALRDPGIEVAAITVVAGNVPLDQAVQNALYTTELCKADVPVFAGAGRPLLRDLQTAQNVHGDDGMGDIGLPLSGRAPAQGWGPNVIVETVMAADDDLTLVALGPLTNLAIALLWAPELANGVERVVVMGGTGLNGPGNVSPNAEFNFWADPEAARVVLRSGLPLELVGWDISIASAVVTEDRASQLRGLDTPYADFSLDIQAVLDGYVEDNTGLQGPDLPDPIAMAHAIDPEPATMAFVDVDIAIGPDPMRGTMIVDRFGFADGRPNVNVVTEYPEESFFDLLSRRLG